MSLFGRLGSLFFLRRHPQGGSGIASSQPSSQSSPPPSAQPSQSSNLPQPRIKTLSELEQELEAASIQRYAQTLRPVARPRRKNGFKALIGWAVVLGLPVGVVWFVNLPFPPVRRPIAHHAPILLVPSYMNMDYHYRQAIVQAEQASQLLNQPTTPADIDLGAQKIEQAQASLDQLPIWLWDELPGYRYWWYSSRLSYSRFNSTRAELGRLQAKVFQERNAQTALFEAEQALATAKQNYLQAATSTDRQLTLSAWRAALDQINQISSQTLAGRNAQQRLVTHQREFQDIVGLAAGNERVATLIEVAREFAGKAAQAGQNPPHSVEEWQQVESLWQEAIARLERIPQDDLAGYAEAQRLLATYRANIEQIKVRRLQEQNSVAAFQSAQFKIQRLQESIPDDPSRIDRNYTISQLQGIINELERVNNGTTVYPEAQQLLLSAKNKLNQF